MAATSEEIVEGFEEFDIQIDEADIVDKLVDIAKLFVLDADNLVNEWLAYQSRYQQCFLTYFELEQLEQELISVRSKSRSKVIPKFDNNFFAPNTSVDTLDIMENYCSPSNKSKLRSIQVNTPNQKTPDVKLRKLITQTSPFFSPPTSSQKYSSRTNSGEITAHLYESDAPDKDFWNETEKSSFVFKKINGFRNPHKYMFQKITDICDVLNDNVESLAEEIQKQFVEEIESFAPCSAPSQNEVVVVGQIKSEISNKLTPQGIVMQGDRVNSFGRSVNVGVERLSKFSLFPGQVVAMRGTNPTGQKFIASDVFVPPYKDGRMVVGNIDSLKIDRERLSIMMVCGPFTTSDSLSYEPLQDFISVVKLSRPDFIIIIGPLIDSNCDIVEKGQVDRKFSQLGQDWIDFICTSLDGYTQIVFVPSQRDVFHHPVYPQPPYEHKKIKNAHFMVNPSAFRIGDVNIGVNSADILFHLGGEEISKSDSSSGDRMSRLASHLLSQKSFYPLYPPHESLPLDIIAAEHGNRLPQDLDILILPSDLRGFIKCLNGRICINPGRLSKGLGGGTYSRLVVGGKTKDQVVAEIVKI